MKQNDLSDVTYKLSSQAYENIFNVYTDDDGFYFYNLLRTVNVPTDLDSSKYYVYEVVHNDTWPYIAWKNYRNVKLWWIITSTNQIIDPTVQPAPGVRLNILRPEVVRNLLNYIKSE